MARSKPQTCQARVGIGRGADGTSGQSATTTTVQTLARMELITDTCTRIEMSALIEIPLRGSSAGGSIYQMHTCFAAIEAWR